MSSLRAQKLWKLVRLSSTITSSRAASSNRPPPSTNAPADPAAAKGSLASEDKPMTKFDKITHTGQAWDDKDRRLARFTFAEKQVNPNIAAHLIAEAPPIEWNDHVAHCDGGDPALGHPRVYINLDKPGTHACGYCGLRFYNPHFTKPDQMDIAHIQV